MYIAYIRPFVTMVYDQIAPKKNSHDGDYLFCSERSPYKCWDGEILSDTFQRESLARMGVRIGLLIYRQLAIGITKTFLKSIALFFDKDDKLCEMLLMQNKNFFIFA